MKDHLLFLFSLCFFVGCFSFMAQEDQDGLPQSKAKETGLPFIQNYTPDEYNAFTQNWGTVQDSLGMLYFANGQGILIYDGVDWQLIELPRKSHPKSIAIDKKNRVYVGASGEFGYLEPNAQGLFTYVSLSSLLDESDQVFSTIWNVIVAEDGVYFCSREAIFKWENDRLIFWKADNNNFRFSFLVNGKLLLMDANKGLVRMENNEFKLIPNGEFYLGKGVTVVLPYDDNNLLVGTLDNFYLHSTTEVIPFLNEAQEFLRQSFPYHGIVLNDGTFAIATLNAGLVVIDKNGKQKLLLNDKEYLGSLEVYKLFQDSSGILWATLGNGIAKIEYPSPFTDFKNLGGDFRAFAMTRYRNKLYVGTENGLFELKHNAEGKYIFENVLGIKDRIWDLLVFEGRLLVAWPEGFYEIIDNEKRHIHKISISQFLRSSLDSNRVFLSMAHGFESIYFNNGDWIHEGPVNGITGATYSIVEEPSGNIWLETSEDWIWRINFESREKALVLQNPVVEKWGVAEGLPGERGGLLKVDNSVYFVPNQGNTSYSFNKEQNSFTTETPLNNLFKIQYKNIRLHHVDAFENVLFSVTDNEGVSKNYIAWKKPKPGYDIETLNENRITGLKDHTAFLDTEKRVIWYGGDKGVVRHDLNQKLTGITNGRTLIKKIIFNQDSLLISGPYHTKNLILPYSNKMLRFEYSSTGYYQEKNNLYQYFLEGFEKDWSNWTSETKKDYTNIPEGNYVFRVRSKNIFGEINQEDSFAFEIYPPWYRSGWAYLLYIFILFLIIKGILYWRSNQLIKKNRALEKLISERTNEIIQKNTQLENQTLLLKEQTEQLKVVDKMKTRLFANISHEFRTPLTLIKGPIEIAEQSPEKPMSLSNIKMVRRNADRLLKLVNQLLDLSKIDAGNLQLEPSEGNTYKCLSAAASSFSSHAAQRNMDYQIKIPSTTLWASFDRDKLEKIVYNLLSNAFKFTPDNETIIFSANYLNNKLNIEVKDTGYGIPPERLQYIFDRFYQVDDSFTKEKEGTGIGLSLTKELVDLMEGSIYVESEYGKGTQFKIIIPLVEIVPAKIESKSEYSFNQDVFDVQENTSLEEKNPDKSTILIIEDHKDMRDFINQQLKKEYHTIEAFNGKDGLQKAIKHTPDLIITDLMMPQIDGISLCKKLKLNIHTSHIPVIMLTAKAGIENKIEGLQTGADDYLTKPFHILELQVRIKNLIDQRKNLKELFLKSNYINPKEVTVNSLDEQFLQKTLDLFEEKYVDPDFGITQMQESLAMSNAQLHRKFKAITSQSPGELLRNFRLKRAAQILEQKGENVTQVAYAVGFNNLSYFAKCFKELFGVSPSKYQKQNNKL